MTSSRLRTRRDLDAALCELLQHDPRLVSVAEVAGPLPMRLAKPGFEGLLKILVGQQVSTASAEAIWRRLSEGLGTVTPEHVLAHGVEELRDLGLSRPKARYALALSEAVQEGRVDFRRLSRVPDAAVVEELTQVKGIGPWTAEIYCLFCLGRPDVWPGLDLALQESVRLAFGLPERPGAEDCLARAEPWRPYRGVAARLFWAYYRAVKGR